MALIVSAFVLSTPVGPRRCRLFLVVFLVRMWRLNAIERLMLPLPRTRKRFFAPLLVFILGMTSCLYLLPTAVFSGGETFGPASGFFGGAFTATFFGASSITICRPSSRGNDS